MVDVGVNAGCQRMLMYDMGVKYIPRSSGSNIGSMPSGSSADSPRMAITTPLIS